MHFRVQRLYTWLRQAAFQRIALPARIRAAPAPRVRFEVQYPDGAPHEVELQGGLVVVGRDPSSDLVLHDVKCSRRHAVVEAGPGGVVVRDTGSANGIYLNGLKIERAPLNPGDVLRLGDTVLKLLHEQDPADTVLMAPGQETTGEMTVDGSLGPATAAPPQPSAREDATAAGRPLTVNVLAALWLMSVPLYGLSGLALALRAGGGVASAAWAVSGLGLAGLAVVMAWGLWSLRPWARVLQIVVAAAGLLVCPFSLAAVVVLAYVLTPPGAAAFSAAPPGGPGAGRTEAAFASALLGMVALGALLTALAALLPFAA